MTDVENAKSRIFAVVPHRPFGEHFRTEAGLTKFICRAALLSFLMLPCRTAYADAPSYAQTLQFIGKRLGPTEMREVSHCQFQMHDTSIQFGAGLPTVMLYAANVSLAMDSGGYLQIQCWGTCVIGVLGLPEPSFSWTVNDPDRLAKAFMHLRDLCKEGPKQDDGLFN